MSTSETCKFSNDSIGSGSHRDFGALCRLRDGNEQVDNLVLFSSSLSSNLKRIEREKEIDR